MGLILFAGGCIAIILMLSPFWIPAVFSRVRLTPFPRVR